MRDPATSISAAMDADRRGLRGKRLERSAVILATWPFDPFIETIRPRALDELAEDINRMLPDKISLLVNETRGRTCSHTVSC